MTGLKNEQMVKSEFSSQKCACSRWQYSDEDAFLHRKEL